MGSFSFLRADKTTRRNNLTMHDKYKILVPKEFGGGYIYDEYYDYGYINEYGNAYYVDGKGIKTPLSAIGDLYGLLAYWNLSTLLRYLKTSTQGKPLFDSEPDTLVILEHGDTCDQPIRCKGIDIGCYDDQIDKLKYPLKLVSASYKGTYEGCEMRSYGDPNQGFYKTYWED